MGRQARTSVPLPRSLYQEKAQCAKALQRIAPATFGSLISG